LFFPVIENLEETDSTDEDGVELIEKGRGQHILIIDDEVSVARFEGELLSHHGYQVTVMTDSEMAAAKFLANPDEYDLVITDQSMPIMTGTELAAAVLKEHPDTPIILYTGYIDDLDQEKVAEIGIRELQVKPVQGRNLVSLVQKYLDKPV
jgi:CheY-like chemotaxis protein